MGMRSGWLGPATTLLAASGIALALHCGSNGDGATSPCDGVYAGQCGTPCGKDDDCPTGLYCGADGKCTAACTASSNTCPPGTTCSARGRCEVGSGSFVDGGGSGDSTCVEVNLKLEKQIPTVVVLVDRSGSMTQSFGAKSRWDTLKDTLVGSGSILQTLQAEVNFGLTTYSYTSGDPTCPSLASIAPTLNNYTAIKNALSPLDVQDNTPTGESILRVAGLDDAGAPVPGGFAQSSTGGPKIIILATDGDPDSCADPDSNGTDPPRQLTVWAVSKAYQAGIRTYVIAIGPDVTESHQQAVANVGLGFAADAGDAAPYYRPSGATQLASVLTDIVNGARTCVFALNGSVQAGEESKGTVTLNGQPLGYQDPNGWKLDNPRQLELLGSACNTVKTTSTAQLSVRFPCGTVVDIR